MPKQRNEPKSDIAKFGRAVKNILSALAGISAAFADKTFLAVVKFVAEVAKVGNTHYRKTLGVTDLKKSYTDSFAKFFADFVNKVDKNVLTHTLSVHRDLVAKGYDAVDNVTNLKYIRDSGVGLGEVPSTEAHNPVATPLANEGLELEEEGLNR